MEEDAHAQLWGAGATTPREALCPPRKRGGCGARAPVGLVDRVPAAAIVADAACIAFTHGKLLVAVACRMPSAPTGQEPLSTPPHPRPTPLTLAELEVYVRGDGSARPPAGKNARRGCWAVVWPQAAEPTRVLESADGSALACSGSGAAADDASGGRQPTSGWLCESSHGIDVDEGG